MDKKKLKKIVGELNKASKMHASQADRSGVYINQPLEGAISIIRLEVRIIPPNR